MLILRHISQGEELYGCLKSIRAQIACESHTTVYVDRVPVLHPAHLYFSAEATLRQIVFFAAWRITSPPLHSRHGIPFFEDPSYVAANGVYTADHVHC
jgi:hypothetical protein